MQEHFKKIIEKLKRKKEIIGIILFGSYLKNKKYARDIDICILLNKKYNTSYLAKKKLEYLKGLPDKYDVQIYQLLPLYIRTRILKEGKILYTKDIKKIYNIAYETIKDFEDFKRYYYDYINRRPNVK